MTPELKQKWIEALRSGTYEQGVPGTLFAGGKYCCLGVLCEVANPGALQFEVDGGCFEVLNTAVINRWVEDDPGFVTNNKLANMNDASGPWIGKGRQSFAQIAAWIEEHV